MRKAIMFIVVVFLCVFAGCGDYNNPEATRIRAEWDVMLQETLELQPIIEDWTERHNQFLAGLTDEQLEAYDEYRSTSRSQIASEAAKIITLRRFASLLSEDEWQTFQALAEESGFGWYPKAQELVNRQQSLEKQWEEAKQNARYEYQQSQLRRSQILQYYQHYQQQQSLSGIENAIRNQTK